MADDADSGRPAAERDDAQPGPGPAARDGRHEVLFGGERRRFCHSDLVRTYAEPLVRHRLTSPVRVATRNLARRFARNVYSRFDATVAASRAVANELSAMGVPRVHTVPLGVDLDTPPHLVFVGGGSLEEEFRLESARRHDFGIDPDAIVLTNNCDAVLRDTRALFGLDPAALGDAQDAILVENIASPRRVEQRRVLSSNAIPARALRALSPGSPLLTVTYEQGIGLDRTPTPRIVRRTIAEATALGAAPVLKGTEYLDSSGRFTVFTTPGFDGMREAAGWLFRWIDANRGLFENATPRPDVGILLDDRALRDSHGPTAAVTWFARARREARAARRHHAHPPRQLRRLTGHARMPGIVSRQPTLHTPDSNTRLGQGRGLEVELEQWAVLELPA